MSPGNEVGDFDLGGTFYSDLFLISVGGGGGGGGFARGFFRVLEADNLKKEQG